jgi:hypothetical protein
METRVIKRLSGLLTTSLRWSRRGDLNAPSAEYNSAALALSYTGSSNILYYSISRVRRHPR